MVVINLKLTSQTKCLQNKLKWSSSVKAYIFELLKSSNFNLEKNKDKFSFFSYSNLYPIKNNILNLNESYFFDITTSNSDLAMIILSSINNSEIINLGEAQFKIQVSKINKRNIKSNMIIKSISPIIIKKQINGKNKFLNFEENKELYLERLNENLIKKYNDFIGERKIEFSDLNVLENIEIEPIIRKNKNSSFVGININKYDSGLKDNNLFLCGNLLNFKIGKISELQKKILDVSYESGFGSSCSYGMGYLKEVDKK